MRAWRLALTALFLVGLVPFLLTDALAKKGGKPKPPPDSMTNPALAFIQGNSRSSHVYVMSTDGTKQQTTSGKERIFRYAPAWSPDGSVIAFLKPAGHPVMDLYFVAPDGSGLTLVHTFDTPGAAVQRYEGLSWFPDGTRLLCVLGNSGTGHADLHVLDVLDGSTTALGLDLLHFQVFGGSVGPDLEPATPGYQGLICYGATDGAGAAQDVHVVEVATAAGASLEILPETITELTLPDAQGRAAWSPDGSQIAYLDGNGIAAGGAKRLAVVSFDAVTMSFGTPMVLVDEEQGYQVNKPSWSPDGLWIGFTKAESGGDSDILRIRPDGTGLTNMTNSSRKSEQTADWNPAWVNDIGP